jgi:hypothetical protein
MSQVHHKPRWRVLFIRRNARCEGEEGRVEFGLAFNEKRMIRRLPGRRKSGWPVAFGRTVTAVFSPLAIAGTPGAAAHAAQHASVRFRVSCRSSQAGACGFRC